MYYVYILRSSVKSERIYIGYTNNVNKRINQHNTKPSCSYTKSFGPWVLEAFIAVKTKKKAEGLEKYIKTGSGAAFLHKRLL